MKPYNKQFFQRLQNNIHATIKFYIVEFQQTYKEQFFENWHHINHAKINIFKLKLM